VDQEWGDWPEDGYGEDVTDDLSASDHPLADDAAGEALSAAGLDGYDDHDGYAGDPDDGVPPVGGSDYLEDDPMGGFEPGPGDADDHAVLEDAPEPVDGSLDTVVGADPDLDPSADWSPAEFPEPLEVTPPDPVDGYPWSDPSAVAAPGTGVDDPAYGSTATPPAGDLLDYAGADADADPWSALLSSDDPATSSLARWWAPG
jgi:hypothetical protein